MAWSSSVLARSSAADRSGKAERERFSIRNPGAVNSPKTLSRSPRLCAIDDFGERGTRLGVCRTFACVVAAVEFAVGALEVVPVEASRR